MRIIAGFLGGRLFDAPSGHKTHPMGDRVKGGLFNTLGDIEGLTFFDCFGGSGALAFEAISRGAVSALVCENDRHAGDVIERNIKSLSLEKSVRLVKANVLTWSQSHVEESFDVVIADPPYDKAHTAAIEQVAKHSKASGVFVLSWPGSLVLPTLPDCILVKSKSYGDAQLGFYKRSER